MPAWVWIILNTLIGLPVALAAVVVAREAIRAVAAPLLGFRVFEVQLGAGERVFHRPLGPIDLGLAPLPLGGATIARAGSPRRHRAGRIALALLPLLAQLAWLAGRLIADTAPGAAPLFEGMAPLACLDLANVLLLTGHATIALELSARVRTDIRLFLDAILGRADSDRAARANHYARLARHRLERADVDGARAALALGLRQLGPEDLLVECERVLDAADLTSVVDQGECCDAMVALIEAAEPTRAVERAHWGLGERLRQGAFSAAPLSLALATLVMIQADGLARSFERGLLGMGDRLVARADATACAGLLTRWTAWADRVDPWLPPSDADRSDRHLALARLERCRGGSDAAGAHYSAALLAANAAQHDAPEAMVADPARWLENELRVALLLREAARVDADRRAYRDALFALGRAEKRLDTLGGRLAQLGAPAFGDGAHAEVGREREEVRALRERVIASMRPR